MHRYPYFTKQILLHEKYIQILIPIPFTSPVTEITQRHSQRCVKPQGTHVELLV